MQAEMPMIRPLDTPIYLKAREILPIEDGAGLEVKCLRGTLWITQSGDCEDRILDGGESFVLDRPGLSLVNALLDPALVIVQRGMVPLRSAA
jgi:Protein of unknown function (DUF2917)